MSLEKKILHLILKNGASTSKLAFEVDTIIAGRNPDSPLPLIHKDISRKHIGIYIRGTDIVIEDLGSTNGTFVNGEKLTPYAEKVVTSSDDIWIGGLKAIQMQVELEYYNLPKIEEMRADEGADTVLFNNRDLPAKPLNSPVIRNNGDRPDPFANVPKVPNPSLKVPSSVPTKPATAPVIPVNVMKAPESERALATRQENLPSEGSSRRAANEEMYLAQLEEMKQKIILNTNNKAAEIIRSAKIEAEMKTQDIYAQAQRSRKEAEDFYIKRIHEAGRAAEELQREAQRHSDELFQKTREQCETLRRSTTETLTLLQSDAQKESERMYFEMEQQVRQSKAQRLADFEVGLQQREKDYLQELEKKNEDRQREFIDRIESRRKDHDQSLNEERQEFDARIEKELREHVEKITREASIHDGRIERESAEHEAKITKELREHTERIARESLELNHKITSELAEHNSRISRELEVHNDRLNREKQEHELRLSSELAAQTSRLDLERKTHEEKINNENAALFARIESEMEEHQQRIAKEKTEWETTLQRAQEDWDSKLKGLESDHKSLLEKAAEAKTEFEVRSAELTKAKDELDKTQTFLKATMSSYEQVRKDLAEALAKKESVEKEFASEKAEYENISSNRKRLNEELQELEKHLERERLSLKDKLESERARYAKTESDYSTALRQETLNQMKKLELEMMSNIARKKATISKELLFYIEKNSQVINTQPESWRKEREKIEKNLIEQFDRHIHGSGAESSIPKDMDLKKQARTLAFKQGGLGLVMGLVLVFGGQYIHSKMYGASPMERAVASQQEARQKDLEARRFNPPKDPDVRDSYVDSVIYTEGFVEIYDQEAFQKDFSMALAKDMLKLWKVDEDSSLQVASISRALVKALQEKKQAIHPDYVQNGLAKMRELEKDARTRITKLLGTNVRYEAFKRVEKEYFEKHRAMR